MTDILAAIARLCDRPLDERIAAYNAVVRAASGLVEDVIDAPCLCPRLVPVEAVRANDYNPNHVAPPEMALLLDSVRADGVTMPIVTIQASDGWEVVDGFHRRRVITESLGLRWLPVVEIDATRGNRIASTVRHNRARGKHSVEKMAVDVVRALLAEGWDDARIGKHLGMSPEEVLRLRQTGGCARALAASEYSHPWRRPNDPNDLAGK